MELHRAFIVDFRINEALQTVPTPIHRDRNRPAPIYRGIETEKLHRSCTEAAPKKDVLLRSLKQYLGISEGDL